MNTNISRLNNIFFTLFGLLILVGISLLFIPQINVFNFPFENNQIKIILIVLNTIGIVSIKMISHYFDTIESAGINFEKKIGLFKTKMISSFVIIYLLEVINFISYLMTGENLIIAIYFLLAILLFVFIPNKKNIEKLGK